MAGDRYLKEDPERAEAVLETIWRALPKHTASWQMHDNLFQHKTFLMEVFRAVRGERD